MVRLSSLTPKPAPTPEPTMPRVSLPGELAVVCVFWSPAGWRSLHRNYLRFLHEMRWWGVPTYNVEVAYEGQEFATPDAWLQIRGGREHVLWQKERLINLAVERLPERFDKVAWIDADMIFLDPTWPERVCQMLEEWPVVQMWDTWHCADADGKVASVKTCVGTHGERYVTNVDCCPGGAWAARRTVWPLYDRHIVGSGDSMMVEGWTGHRARRCLRMMNEPMEAHFRAWSADAYAKVQSQIACLPGDAMHLYHGRLQDRQYHARWYPVIDGGYDPARHVRIDDTGLLAWTQEASPELVEWVAGYFHTRREDE
jgi:hypothetical protein